MSTQTEDGEMNQLTHDGTGFPFFSEDTSVEVVNLRMGGSVNPRLKQVMTCLIQHLHAFIKEIELTQEEWELGIDFVTRTGQLCSEERQEFILLSDVLGISMLVDAVNNRHPFGATESTVFGPFHVEGAPHLEMGANISLDAKGEKCLFEGRVIDIEGNPIEGAVIDVWCDNAAGYYDVQQPELQPKWNNRGVFITGADGLYSFYGIKPVSYPIPNDGPVGQLLEKLDRHPYRPAHIHFRVAAKGYRKLITHIFTADSLYIDSDAVFGVKKSLITPFKKCDRSDAVWSAKYNFVLAS